MLTTLHQCYLHHPMEKTVFNKIMAHTHEDPTAQIPSHLKLLRKLDLIQGPHYSLLSSWLKISPLQKLSVP